MSPERKAAALVDAFVAAIRAPPGIRWEVLATRVHRGPAPAPTPRPTRGDA